MGENSGPNDNKVNVENPNSPVQKTSRGNNLTKI